MELQSFVDGFRTSLVDPINTSDTLIKLEAGWANLPTNTAVGGNTYIYYLVIQNDDVYETVKVTGAFNPNGTVTVVRSATPKAFPAGSVIAVRPSKATMDHVYAAISAAMTAANTAQTTANNIPATMRAAAQTWTGANTFNAQMTVNSAGTSGSATAIALKMQQTVNTNNAWGIFRVISANSSAGNSLLTLATASTELFKVTADGTTLINGTLNCSGNIVGYYSSDERLKENIKPIENALDKVLKLGGYTYAWKEGCYDPSSQRKNDFGFRAQDFVGVFDEAVHTRDDGTLALDYLKVSALTIQAIKELHSKLEAAGIKL